MGKIGPVANWHVRVLSRELLPMGTSENMCFPAQYFPLIAILLMA